MKSKTVASIMRHVASKIPSVNGEQLEGEQAKQAEAEAQKAHHDAEKALTRTASLVRGFSGRDDKPLVGNLIGEDHVNYVLMYNMLTGIRIAVRPTPILPTRILLSVFHSGFALSSQNSSTIDGGGLFWVS